MDEQQVRQLLGKLNACAATQSSFLGGSYTYNSFKEDVEKAGFNLSDYELEALHSFVHKHTLQGWSVKSICGHLGI